MQLFALSCLFAVISTVYAQEVFADAGGGITTVTSITTNGTNGALYPAGTTIYISVTFNATVFITNPSNLQLSLNTGDYALYVSGNDTETLVFSYTVPDGGANAVTSHLSFGTPAFVFGTATVVDSKGDDTTLSGTGGSAFDPTVSSQLDPFINNTISVDGIAPTLQSVTFGTGNYSIDQIVPLYLTFDEAVRVIGTVKVGVLGLTFSYIGYNGTDNTTLEFGAPVIESVHSVDLAAIVTAGSLTVTLTSDSANSIADTAGNHLVESTAAFESSVFSAISDVNGKLFINADLGITGIISVYADKSNTTLHVGDTLNIYVVFDRLVTIAIPNGANGNVTLTLNNGGIATIATSVTNGATLHFQYVVKASDNSETGSNFLDVASTGALSLGGISLTDDVSGSVSAGTVSLLLPSGSPQPGQNSTLRQNNLQVVTTGDVIISITTPNTTGVSTVYFEGADLWINVTFSAPVTVSGNPTLLLSNGGTATYNAGFSNGASVIFVYVVRSSDTVTTQLTINNRNALQLNTGGAINDATTGNAANITIPSSVNLGLNLYAEGSPDVIARLIIEFLDSNACGSDGLASDEAAIEKIISDNLDWTFTVKESSCVNQNKRQTASDVTLEFDITDFNGNEGDFADNIGNITDAINNLAGVQLVDISFSGSPVLVPTLFGLALLFLSLLMKN